MNKSLLSARNVVTQTSLRSDFPLEKTHLLLKMIALEQVGQDCKIQCFSCCPMKLNSKEAVRGLVMPSPFVKMLQLRIKRED